MLTPKMAYVIDRVLHWLASLFIMLMLMGNQIHNVDYRIKGAITHKQDAIEIHVMMAAVVLIALIARFIWSRFFLPAARKPHYQSKKHQIIVHSIHTMMYLVIFSLMVTGLLMVNNYKHPLTIANLLTFSQSDVSLLLFNQANNLHLFLESAIYFLITLHLIGAMYSKR